VFLASAVTGALLAGAPAKADAVRVGYTNLYVDLPFVTAKDSKITADGPTGPRIAQSYVAIFWSEEWGRILSFVAIIPREYSYFTGEDPPLEQHIGDWSFFTDKTVSDHKPIACVYGTCLGFKADDAACAVFRRQIGSAGKQRSDARSDSAGPRLYGFYCSYASASLTASEVDAVLSGITER
jgi:hypothetical protein